MDNNKQNQENIRSEYFREMFCIDDLDENKLEN